MTDKANIFDHIYYEISEYLFSFDLIQRGIKDVQLKDDTNIDSSITGNILQSVNNNIWTAHFNHLRNVLDFFTNRESSSRTDDIFITDILIPAVTLPLIISDKRKISFKSTDGLKDVNCWNIINKTVEHLSIGRFELGHFWDNPDIEQNGTKIHMIKLLFDNHIHAFFKLLLDRKNVQSNYQNHWDNYKNKIITYNDILENYYKPMIALITTTDLSFPCKIPSIWKDGNYVSYDISSSITNASTRI